MVTIDCNADLDHPCDADNGEMCPKCAAYFAEAEAYFSREWAVASPAERDPEKYRADMIDAWRGHLL